MDEHATNTYLTFHLGNELFAVPVSQVKEIIEVLPITEIPYAPEYMRGILNLRGNVLSVVDLKQKVKKEAIQQNSTTRIIIFNIDDGANKHAAFGGMVDQTRDVVEINEEEIMPPPEIYDDSKAKLVKGVVNREGFILLININDVLQESELDVVREAATPNV